MSAHVPWHQDGDGTVRTVWIALDDISSKNGGLVVMRGGHDAGRRTLKHVESQEELTDAIRHAKYNVFAIQDKDIVDKATYAYEFPAGGAGIHHPLLPHMSYRNTTDRARRVLILRYTTDKDAKNDRAFSSLLNHEIDTQENVSRQTLHRRQQGGFSATSVIIFTYVYVFYFLNKTFQHPL